MAAQENKKNARRIVVEIFNAGNVGLVDRLIAADFVDHALPPDLDQTREGFRSMLPILRRAFPDLEYTIEDQIAEGDVVVQRLTARGTLEGEFMGMPPTGRKAVWQEMHWHKFNADGELAEHWDTTDTVGMMAQLHTTPSPG